MTATTIQTHKKSTCPEWRFKLHCVTDTPLHVGAGRAGPTTDAELRRDSRNRLVISGSSIAGAIRQMIERLAKVDRPPQQCRHYMTNQPADKAKCGCDVCRLLGDVSPTAEATESRVVFYDAPITNSQTRVVDGVAIDRKRRAAADAKKFDYEQVLPQAHVDVEVRARNLTDQERQWLGAALRMLAQGRVRLGGRTNRGHGALKGVGGDCRMFYRDLGSVDDLLALATQGDTASWHPIATKLSEFPGQQLVLDQRITASFTMASRATLLIVDPVRAAETNFDRAQRKLRDKAEIPVSSFVGVLRSGAERIVRTLGGVACHPTECRCQPPDNAVINDAWCCLTCRLFGNEDWASRLSATVTSLAPTRDLPFDHVAIDRFTGGASDHKKFDALASMGGMFRVELTVELSDQQAHDPSGSRWIIGLLALVLRDLHDGRLWFGHGGSKGHGLVELQAEPCWQVPDSWRDLASDIPACVAELRGQFQQGNEPVDE